MPDNKTFKRVTPQELYQKKYGTLPPLKEQKLLSEVDDFNPSKSPASEGFEDSLSQTAGNTSGKQKETIQLSGQTVEQDQPGYSVNQNSQLPDSMSPTTGSAGTGQNPGRPLTTDSSQLPTPHYNIREDILFIPGTGSFHVAQKVDEMRRQGLDAEAEELERYVIMLNSQASDKKREVRRQEYDESQTITPKTMVRGQPLNSLLENVLYNRKKEKYAKQDDYLSDVNRQRSQALQEKLLSGIEAQMQELRDEPQYKEWKQGADNLQEALLKNTNAAAASGLNSQLQQYMVNRPNNIRQAEAKLAKLNTAKDVAELAYEWQQSPGQTGINGLWKGLTSGKFKDFITFGLSEMSQNAEVIDALDKAAKGGIVSPEEQTLINAYQSLNEIQKGVERPISYEIGAGLQQMIPFMVEMYLTSGANTAVRAGLKKALRSSSGAAGRSIGRKAADLAIDGLAYTAGAATQSLAMPHRILNEYTRQELNEYDFIDNQVIHNPTSIGGKAYRAAMQNFTEVFSEGLLPGNPGGLLPGGGKAVKGKAVNAINRFIKDSGIGSLFGEYIEENMGDVMYTLLTGDGSLKDIADPRHQIILFGTVALFGGAMKGMQNAGQGIDNKSRNIIANETAKMFNPEVRNNIDRVVNNFNETNGAAVFEQIAQLPYKQLQPALEYFGIRMAQKGQQIANIDATREKIGNFVDNKTGTVKTAVYANQDGFYIIDEYLKQGKPYYRIDKTVDGVPQSLEVPAEAVNITGEYDAQAYADNEVFQNTRKYAFTKQSVEQLLQPFTQFNGNVLTASANIDGQQADIVILSVEDLNSPDQMVRVVPAAELGQPNARIRLVHTKNIGEITGVPVEQISAQVADDQVGAMNTAMQKKATGQPTMSQLNGDDIRGKEVVLLDQNGQPSETVGIVQRLVKNGITLPDGSMADGWEVIGIGTDAGQKQIYPREQIVLANENQQARTPEQVEQLQQPEVQQTTEAEIQQEQQNPAAEPTQQEPITEPVQEEQPEPQLTPIQQIERNAPKQKDGSVDYNALSESNPSDFAILWESQFGAEQTESQLKTVSNNIGKQITAKRNGLNKTTDFNKIAKAQTEIAALQAKKETIDNIIAERYTTPKTETPPATIPSATIPFKQRLNELQNNLFTTRDKILYGIASGEYRFRWNDQKTPDGQILKRGIATELGLTDSETERRSRINILSNNGYTVESLAHQLWEESLNEGIEINDNDIRDEIIDILASVSSRTQALEQLDNRIQLSEDQYAQQQQEAAQYYAELEHQENELMWEAISQIVNEDIVILTNIAQANGIGEQEFASLSSFAAAIDLIEEYEQNRNQRANRNEAQTPQGAGNTSTATRTTTTQRDRPGQNERDRNTDGDSPQHGSQQGDIRLEQQVADAESDVDTNPSQAQKEAGNYKKGHLKIQGFDISIEQPKGSIRSGVNQNSKPWSQVMNNTYGYFRQTQSKDGDHIDLFLGDNLESQKVFVVDQINSDGSFDEHKVMLGFNTIEEARQAYLSNYEDGWQGLGNITETDIETFRQWAATNGKRIKPFADYQTIKTENGKTFLSEPLQNQLDWKHDTDHVSRMEVTPELEKAREEAGYNTDEQEKITFAERQLTEQGHLTFMGAPLTGAAKIKSAADVAFLFKNLESAATENAFLVMIRKDGTYGVYYASTGATTQVIMDSKLFAAAAKEFGAAKVCLVHNHPTGYIVASPQDQRVHQRIARTMKNIGIEMMDSVVINLDSGQYLKFNENGGEKKNKKADPKKTVEPKIYSFDRQILYKPSSEKAKVSSSDNVAEFLSKQKRGAIPKLQVLITDNAMNVNKYLLLDPNLTTEELLATLIYEVGKHGESVILASNQMLDKNTVRTLKTKLQVSDIALLDVLEIQQDADIIKNYKSWNDDRLSEPDARFQYKQINAQFNNELQQQINGTLPKGHTYRLGHPTAILKSAGIPNLPIELQASRLSDKAMQENHPFSLNEVENLPEAIQNPIAVFDSKTKAGHKVILTELKQGNHNFVVALQINAHPKGYRSNIEINDIRSIYPKDNAQDIVNWINRGDLLKYAHKTKILNWITQQQSNSAEVATPVKDSDIAANIIQNFQNPKLQQEKKTFQPISKRKLSNLVNRLKKTGLAKEVITDRESFTEKLNEVLSGNTAALQTLSEMESIKQRAIADNTFMKAPNGKPTNLSENQWLQVRTQAFINWFGNWINNPKNASKVVDENGEPMVVYHGTNAEFTVFNSRRINKYSFENEYFFTSDKGYAEEMAEQRYGDTFLYEVFLNIKNPNSTSLPSDAFFDPVYEKPIIRKSRENNHDGVFVKNQDTTYDDGVIFIAFAPTQIKSAISNTGAFDPSNPDIRMQVLENTNTGDQINTQFNNELQQQMDGTLPKGHIYNLGMPSKALLSRVKNLPLQMSAATLDLKHGNKNKNLHPFNLENVINLPEAIQNPIAVFESETDSNKTVVLTELKDKKGNNFIAIIDIYKKGDVNLINKINSIISLYPKDSNIRIARWILGEKDKSIGKNLMSWVNPEKALGWLSDHSADLNAAGLPTKSTAKIIQNFQNPVTQQKNTGTSFLRTNTGDVYGFVTSDGTVYLNPDKINANTPIHEFGHLWNAFTKKNNPKLYQQGAELIKDSPYWQQVNQNPAYANLSEDARIDEALAAAIGDKGEAIFNKEPKLTKWINDLWSWIKKKLGINQNVNIQNMTLNDFTDYAAKQLLGGIPIVKKNTNFAGNENNRTKTRLDNRPAMESRSISETLAEPERRSGIYKTISAANTAGDTRDVYTTEQREELEARGVNPDWNRVEFRKELERHAKENKVWLNESYFDDKILAHDRKSLQTSENDVYKNPDGKTLTKVNNLSYVNGLEQDNNLVSFIDRLIAHNTLFPNVSYTIKGVAKNKEGFPSIVLEQPKIIAERNATQEEIDTYLTEVGFAKDGTRSWSNGHDVWTNGIYELFDARPANVLKGKDGNLYFIDTIPHSVEYMQNKEEQSFENSPTYEDTDFLVDDIENPDVQFQIVNNPEQIIRQYNEAKKGIRKTVNDLFERSYRYLADYARPLTNLEKSIEKETGKKLTIDQKPSVYLNTVASRQTAAIEKFDEGLLSNMVNQISKVHKEYGATTEDQNIYLQARHAPERNRAIRQQAAERDDEVNVIRRELSTLDRELIKIQAKGQAVQTTAEKARKEADAAQIALDNATDETRAEATAKLNSKTSFAEKKEKEVAEAIDNVIKIAQQRDKLILQIEKKIQEKYQELVASDAVMSGFSDREAATLTNLFHQGWKAKDMTAFRKVYYAIRENQELDIRIKDFEDKKDTDRRAYEQNKEKRDDNKQIIEEAMPVKLDLSKLFQDDFTASEDEQYANLQARAAKENNPIIRRILANTDPEVITLKMEYLDLESEIQQARLDNNIKQVKSLVDKRTKLINDLNKLADKKYRELTDKDELFAGFSDNEATQLNAMLGDKDYHKKYNDILRARQANADIEVLKLQQHYERLQAEGKRAEAAGQLDDVMKLPYQIHNARKKLLAAIGKKQTALLRQDPIYSEFTDRQADLLTDLFYEGGKNKDMQPFVDAYNGIVNQEALHDIITRNNAPYTLDMMFQNNDYRQWDKAIKAINTFVLDQWLEGGRISRQQYDSFKREYQHYVPLRGWDKTESANQDVEGEDHLLFASARTALAAGFKTSKGRKSIADNVFHEMNMMAHTAIMQMETNKFRQQVAGLITSHDLGQQGRMINQWIKDTGATDNDGNPLYQYMTDAERNEKKERLKDPNLSEEEHAQINEDLETFNSQVKFDQYKRKVDDISAKRHEVDLWIGGKSYTMEFEDVHLADLVGGRKNAGEPQHKTLGKLTRGFSRVLTQLNLSFAIANLARDVQFAIQATAIEKDPKTAFDFTKNLLNVRNFLLVAGENFNKKQKNSQIKQLFDEFIENGSQTGYSYLHSPEEYRKQLTKAIKNIDRLSLNPLRWGGKIFEIIENITATSEDITRFAMYVTIRQQGGTIMEAVSASKEVTVNFNRKGNGKLLGSLFAFFNARLQGSVRFINLIRNHPVKSIPWLALNFGYGVFIQWLTAFLLGDDDELGEKRINPYMRYNYISIPAGKNKYLSIPLAHGFGLFYTLGALSYDLLSKKIDGEDFALEALESTLGGFSPIGIQDIIREDIDGIRKFNWSAVAPSVLQPIVQAEQNRNFLGNRIYPEPFTKEQEARLPRNSMQNRNTPTIYQDISDVIFRFGGGDPNIPSTTKRSGEGTVSQLFDYSPNQIQHVIQNQFGAPGKSVADFISFVYEIAQGTGKKTWDDINWEGFVPAYERFFRDYNTKGYSQDYWNNINEAKDIIHLFDTRLRTISWLENERDRARSNAQYDLMIKRQNKINELNALLEKREKEYLFARNYLKSAKKKDIDRLSKAIYETPAGEDRENMEAQLKEMMQEVNKYVNEEIK